MVNVGNMTVRNCEISNIAVNDNHFLGSPRIDGNGITAYSDSKGDDNFENILIDNNIIHDVGNNGILLSSGSTTYSPGQARLNEVYHFKTLKPTNNSVTRNTIYRASLLTRSGTGVFLRSVGGLVANNTIFEMPRSAVGAQGNDNVFEFNHFYDLNRETQDSGGIYLISRSWLYRNNTLRHNFIHDTGGYFYNSSIKSYQYPYQSWGFYPDDYSSQTYVHDNVVARAPNGLAQVHAGRDNWVYDNVNSQSITHQLYAQGEWNSEHQLSLQSMWNELQMMGSWGFNSQKYYSKYPELSTIPSPEIMNQDNVYANNSFERNIFYFTAHPDSYAYFVRFFLNSPGSKFSKNVIWNGVGESSLKVQDPEAPLNGGSSGYYTWAFWTSRGFDSDSLVADPLFVDPTSDNYFLQPESPAWALGHHNIIVPR
ncbi:MAG: right-handed parallel beta-helix repeat-containing protein [Candidatus Norongarragalinales archaeon]